MGLNEIEISDKIKGIESISKERKNIKQLQSDMFSLLGGISIEDKEKVALKISQITPEDGNQQNNLGFIVPHIVKERFGDGVPINVIFDKNSGNNEKYLNNNKNEKNGFNTTSRGFDRNKRWMDGADNFIERGIIFPPQEVKNMNYHNILDKYKKDQIDKLPDDSKNVVKKLKLQILEQNNGKQLTNKNVIVIPTYAKEEKPEEIKKFIDEIKKQKGDFKAVFYINSYDTDLDDNGRVIKENEYDKVSHQKKVQEIKNLVGGDDRFCVVENHYPVRKPIGTIRADVTDSIISNLNENVDGNLIFLDADTRKLSDGYIKNVEKKLEDPDISYCVGRLRWTTTEAEKHKFVRFAELLSAFGDKLQSDQSIKQSIESSGAATSYKFKDYMKVRGIERSLRRGEDSNMLPKIYALYNKSLTRGAWLNGKVWTDSRRGEKTLVEGKDFHQQWGQEFNPVETSGLDKSKLEKNNIIISNLLLGKEVIGTDITIIEDYVKSFCKKYQKGSRKDRNYIENSLMKYWNINYKAKSLYEIKLVDGNVKFVKKKNSNNISVVKNKQSLLKNGWKEIGEGLQFNVFGKGERVIKIPKNDKEIESYITLKKLSREGITLEKAKKERDSAISFIKEYSGDKAFLGNLKIDEYGNIEQDRCEILDQIIPNHEKNNNYLEIEMIFKDYAKQILKMRRRGFCERSFNFSINNGINKNGEMVLVDFGEIIVDKKIVRQLIENKQWEKMRSYTVLDNKSKEIFKNMMNKYLTLENLNKHRIDKNKR